MCVCARASPSIWCAQGLVCSSYLVWGLSSMVTVNRKLPSTWATLDLPGPLLSLSHSLLGFLFGAMAFGIGRALTAPLAVLTFILYFISACLAGSVLNHNLDGGVGSSGPSFIGKLCVGNHAWSSVGNLFLMDFVFKVTELGQSSSSWKRELNW